MLYVLTNFKPLAQRPTFYTMDEFHADANSSICANNKNLQKVPFAYFFAEA